jgi:integrase/recombinase XerD
MQIIKPKYELVLDTRRAKKHNTYPVRLRINYRNNVKTYLCNQDLTEEDFDTIQNLTKLKSVADTQKRASLRVIHESLQEILGKAAEIIRTMERFSFKAFENRFGINKTVQIERVGAYFDKIIEMCRRENRFGTAQSYQTSKISLELFHPGLRFEDITVEFLKSFEHWMIDEKKRSQSTVGIYLRNLRFIINHAIDCGIINREDNYPFGKRKYQIPESKNIKKALSAKELKAIYDYQVFPTTLVDKAKDMFLFSFFANGINIKDIALLKFSNIQEDKIIYTREKSKNTKRTRNEIIIMLIPELINIINKWKVNSNDKDDYVFPILRKDMKQEEIHWRVKDFTKDINKGLDIIGKGIGLERKLTTYFARHSFATALKHSGTSIAEISESLGHSSLKTTESYLASFDDVSKRLNAKKLQAFIYTSEESV